MLGMPAGSKRYTHIAGVRGDEVAVKALGLRGLLREDLDRANNTPGHAKVAMMRLFRRED